MSKLADPGANEVEVQIYGMHCMSQIVLIYPDAILFEPKPFENPMALVQPLLVKFRGKNEKTIYDFI